MLDTRIILSGFWVATMLSTPSENVRESPVRSSELVGGEQHD